MHPARAPLAITSLVTLLLILACGGDASSEQGASLSGPTAQDTGARAAAAKAEVQAVVAQAESQAQAQEQAQEQARAEAAATEQCDPREPAPVSGPGCVTATIACGQTIQGTTVGGTRHFDGDRYVHSYCFPTTEDSHAGTERVYAFQLATDQRATFVLTSPCADLDLAVLRWENTERCPGSTEAISECEGQNRGGGGTAKIWNNRPARYLAIVDGSAPQGANFELSVTCIDAE
jgi:type II secretory pathway pseudopilin PulG